MCVCVCTCMQVKQLLYLLTVLMHTEFSCPISKGKIHSGFGAQILRKMSAHSVCPIHHPRLPHQGFEPTEKIRYRNKVSGKQNTTFIGGKSDCEMWLKNESHVDLWA